MTPIFKRLWDNVVIPIFALASYVAAGFLAVGFLMLVLRLLT